MPKQMTQTDTPLRDQLDRLAAFEPSDALVLSLYLDTRPDQHGRDNYESFLRKAFNERVRALTGDARLSFERDAEHIQAYLAEHLRKSANGLALFSCSARDLFEAIQLDAPLEEHWLFIDSVPHLYPLARLNDRYPRYAALLVDTNSARLFVFGLHTREAHREIKNVKTRKSAMGGWSQARYQRHLANFHLHHMKEVVDVLDATVREEGLTTIVVACDEVARPALMEQLPKHLAEKVIEVVRLDINTPEHQVLSETMEALRERHASTDAEHVTAMLNTWRAGGLAVVGPEDTWRALSLGQVDELLITAAPTSLRPMTGAPPDITPGAVQVDTSAPNAADLDGERLKLADQLVVKAQQTSAQVRFIENPELLAEVGGVGAILRFKI
jgi:peptide chain release factor subunit 1